MTRKSWTKAAWLACGLAIVSAPGWAGNNMECVAVGRQSSLLSEFWDVSDSDFSQGEIKEVYGYKGNILVALMYGEGDDQVKQLSVTAWYNPKDDVVSTRATTRLLADLGPRKLRVSSGDCAIPSDIGRTSLYIIVKKLQK